MKVTQFKKTVIPEMGDTAFVFDNGGPVDPESDEFKTAMTLDMLIEHGRKMGVKGTTAILNTEAIEFATNLQKRTAALLPNGGLGMDPKKLLPIVEKEMEKMLDEFWSERIQ
jgi:hypothetical protein